MEREKEPMKLKTNGAICYKRMGQIAGWEIYVLFRATEIAWLQMLFLKGILCNI